MCFFIQKGIAFATSLVMCLFFIAIRLEFQTRHYQSVAPQGNISLVCDESARQKLSTDFQVPNIVHYIWYYNDSQPMKFHEMLSVLSAHKMLQPDAIYFHTNVPPIGKYWDRLRELKNFKVSDNYCKFESFHYCNHVCINHLVSNVPKWELDANQTFKIVRKYVFYFHSKN